MNISVAIKKELQKQNITQSELARRLNKPRQLIYKNLKRWEYGDSPNLSTLKEWAAALNVSYLNWLD